MKGWVEGGMGGWIDGWIHGWIDERRGRGFDGWMPRQFEETQDNMKMIMAWWLVIN